MAPTGHEDDGDAFLPRRKLRNESGGVHVWEGQVEEQHVWLEGSHCCERLMAVGDAGDGKAFVAERVLQDSQQRYVVFDYQYRGNGDLRRTALDSPTKLTVLLLPKRGTRGNSVMGWLEVCDEGPAGRCAA